MVNSYFHWCFIPFGVCIFWLWFPPENVLTILHYKQNGLKVILMHVKYDTGMELGTTWLLWRKRIVITMQWQVWLWTTFLMHSYSAVLVLRWNLFWAVKTPVDLRASFRKLKVWNELNSNEINITVWIQNREHFNLILTFPIVQEPIRSNMKPQTNYRYCLRFSFLARDWFFTWNIITYMPWIFLVFMIFRFLQ